MQRSVTAARIEQGLHCETGLSREEVAARLKQYGPNDIVEDSDSNWLTLLRDTARDPMLWFLFGTATLFIVLGDWVEAATLLVAVIPLVGMDLYLHRRTRASGWCGPRPHGRRA